MNKQTLCACLFLYLCWLVGGAPTEWQRRMCKWSKVLTSASSKLLFPQSPVTTLTEQKENNEPQLFPGDVHGDIDAMQASLWVVCMRQTLIHIATGSFRQTQVMVKVQCAP